MESITKELFLIYVVVPGEPKCYLVIVFASKLECFVGKSQYRHMMPPAISRAKNSQTTLKKIFIAVYI
jgi:hypothetical protein